MQGKIDAKVHSIDDLRERVDDYDSLSNKEKLELTRNVDPSYQDEVYNVTTDQLHEYFVENLDPTDTTGDADINASWLGLGVNGGAGTSTTDEDLNDRRYETTVTDGTDNGKELLTSTFVPSDEANGNTFDELGLFSNDPANLTNADVFLINHATFTAITKDNTKTITFDVRLSFSDL